jgi:hypothetical protein
MTIKPHIRLPKKVAMCSAEDFDLASFAFNAVKRGLSE